MERFGLLGKHLQHSYSPEIHRLLAGYDYRLYEVEPEDLERFLRTTDLCAMNVTIPYKKAVLPLCAGLSETARRVGSVNTLLRRDGGWWGENTDYSGFVYLLRSAEICVRGQKVLVLGDGGAAAAVRQALWDQGAAQVITVSRRGPVRYEDLDEHRDAGVIVNTTPVGMYPDNGAAAVEVADFPALTAVADIIYNPTRTKLLFDAAERGLKAAGGLGMLVAQARRASELFTGSRIEDARVEQIVRILQREKQNIILIGMPASGKTTVGTLLARELGRDFFDADEVLVEQTGRSIPEIFAEGGEEAFRTLETKVLAELGKRSGAVIATGGGCITRPENERLLRQNGVLVWLKRNLSELSSEGRPLSQKHGAAELYARRAPLYEAFSDFCVENEAAPEQTVRQIMEGLL